MSIFLLNKLENHNCVNVTRALAQCFKLNITQTLLSNKLGEHPEFPSLLSISDTLMHLNVDNITIQGRREELLKYPTPFLTQVNAGVGSMFTVIKSITDEKVVYSAFTSQKWKEISLDDFLETWTPVVTFVEPLDQAGEINYKENRRTEIKKQILNIAPIAILIFALLATISNKFYTNGISAWINALFMLSKFAGTAVSFLILSYGLNKENSTLQKYCQSGEHINCEAVMNSGAAKIGGFISMGEAAFFYFCGGMIMLLFSGLTAESIGILSLLSLTTIPVITFSLYYQWRVIKQWCSFCLVIISILVMEVVLSCYSASTNLDWSKVNWISFLLSFAIPSLSWLLVRDVFLSSQQSVATKTELTRLKTNQTVFENMSVRQKYIGDTAKGLGILLGSNNPRHVITKVCNPYCPPCAKSHSDIEELLSLGDDIQVQIIFTASNDITDVKRSPAIHLVAIARLNDTALLKDALHDWYSNKYTSYTAFAAVYNMVDDLDSYGPELDKMKSWCNEIEINFTPTFFINGYQLPDIYTIADVKNFVV
ncbi:vitamin K epoxide reductase family protein [Chitinophaga sp. Cy-1792]|uniref:vitamin K epoxide reductase family protein n=1 Tax=Chitinophaga sp. Cy-1792 TaxID=2608339 RepID=UPI002107F132|nr:vitamin K epoxide reductase family protein [Chitinophaga sp. Cy-1792]